MNKNKSQENSANISNDTWPEKAKVFVTLKSGIKIEIEDIQMYEDAKIFILIDKCFELGKGGWNDATDRDEYFSMAYKFAKELGIIKK